MLSYRPFRNVDPPAVADLWHSRAGQSGLTTSVSPDLLEQLIFAKLYFDYDGLIIARDDDRPVGFVHAGFGPNEQKNDVSPELGVTSIVLVRPDCEQVEVAAGLLEQSETYLHDRGAKVLYGGGIYPLNPFYLGLYGGSELPGVLESDEVAQQLYRSHGYQEIDRTLIFHRDLHDFEAPIDRSQMQIRRQMIVEMTDDPPSRDWWEGCTIGDFDLTQFDVIPRVGGPPVASATFRTMEPIGTVATGQAVGLIEFYVEESLRRRGMAVFLMTEAFRQFLRHGIGILEAQCMHHNVAAVGLYQKLGFQQVGQGSVFRKSGVP